MYYALIGDMVNSKEINNRKEIQEKLELSLNEINETYKEQIASNFIITLGDEFQGLLNNSDKIFEIIIKIQLLMKAQKIRFGIGIGDILTKINRERSIGSDGPAWWNARNMITELKQNEKGLKGISDIKVSGLENKNVLDLINVNLSLCHSIEQKWTSDQRKIIEYIVLNYGLTTDFTQRKIAEELSTSAVNLNKKLKLSLFYDYVHCLNAITKLL